MSAVKPILFSGTMVRAIIREVEKPGTGKTQTRRVLKPQPDTVIGSDFRPLPIGLLHVEGEPLPRITQGRVLTRQEVRFAVGDLLWVREAHCFSATGGYDAKDGYDIETGANSVWFRATDEGECDGPWSPSIHMSRWASRLTLEVTAVRVERLHDISEEDARAEGAPSCVTDGEGHFFAFEEPGLGTFRCGFAGLWSSINGADSWEDNPWVAALTFQPHLVNVDELLRQRAVPA